MRIQKKLRKRIKREKEKEIGVEKKVMEKIEEGVVMDEEERKMKIGI